jgi:GAF domain-containing protein
VSTEHPQEQIDLLKRERDEALEQQAATSEVLRVISRSPGDLQPVFDIIAANALRLCGSTWSAVLQFNGELIELAAVHNLDDFKGGETVRRSFPRKPSRTGVTDRAISTRTVTYIRDVLEIADYEHLDLARAAAFRSILSTPMLSKGQVVGAITVVGADANAFTDRHIDLLKTFADQAVIAIENVRLFEAEQERTRELSESLEQQTATSEVLRVISSSPGELEPVFQTILSNATRLCEAKFGTLYRYDGGEFYPVTFHQVPSSFADFLRQRGSFVPPAGTPLDRLLRTGKVIRTADDSTEETPSPSARIAGARSHIAVPMFKDDQLTGAIVIYRTEVRPFTDKQIELVTNFAAQAVIAIENTRLLSELRESLQQQTATADVLKVISSSPGELKPVFNAMLENAVRICDAKLGNLWLCEGSAFRVNAMHGAPPAYADFLRRNPVIHNVIPGTALGRIASERRAIQIIDAENEKAYAKGTPFYSGTIELARARTIIAVPLLKDEELVGAIVIYRQEVRPFTDKQIELLQNFAAQAVIAIENTRLLNELRESLQQQTATADVLKVISRSTFDLQAVLDTLVESAARLCEADMASINREKGASYQQVASYGYSPEYQAYMRDHPISAGRGSVVGRTVMQGRMIHIADVLADPDYKMTGAAKVGGTRTMLGVPLLREGTPIGVIVLQRKAMRSFTDKQVELVETFADQAVIAIENTRLLGELRESLQQQTATADVLKVISRSTFDLQTVLQTLVESAARLCDADKTIITREKNGVLYRAEAYGFSREFMERVRDTPIKAERGSGFGRALLEGRVIHIPDVKADPEYTFTEHQRLGDFRTLLAVPMLREGVASGVVSLVRSEVRPFTDKQIELATTFADQAAIAIENVRLFERVEARTRELAKSLEDLRTTQDRLVQTQKLASLGQLTAGIAHEIKNPLNFVNNFSVVSSELIDELQATLKGPLDDKARAEINDLTNTLRGNLDKVVQHGKRADAIVKNMLLHSREGSGEHRRVDVNALVEESLNLAWHGARAEKQGFDITLERSFDPTTGEADVFPQDITRTLLNLISNGFYAATKRKAETNGGDYVPILAASTKSLGDRVEIRIRDNGTGIPPEVKEKMFNPFFTTKPAGEGTGLGLSICHDIIVKQHGGSIEVDTRPGEFTEIRVILPRAAALLPERP